MIRGLVVSLLAAVLLTGCGDDDSSSSAAPTTTAAACAPEQAHPIDPGSGQHLLPGAPDATYNTDPPTSGAHAPGRHATGILIEPVPRAVQVAMLEAGHALLQYRDASPEFRDELESIVTRDDVSVAPNPSLDAPIVATAWLYSMRCERFDKTALESFVRAHAGKNEGH